MTEHYQAPLGRIGELKHLHPKRTAKRAKGLFKEIIEFKVFSTRRAMAKAVRRDQNDPPAIVGCWSTLQDFPLSETEGY